MFGKPFPFEGNWNSSAGASLSSWTPFGKPFPFEGNWNQCTTHCRFNANGFGKPFPFEGNWNSFSVFLLINYFLCVFGKPFPFEGNWNLQPYQYSALHRLIVRKAFPVWRELKRTLFPILVSGWCPVVRKAFPVWRELKLGDFQNPIEFLVIRGSESLSRLKGIETSTQLLHQRWQSLWSSESLSRLKGIETFSRYIRRIKHLFVRKAFPVWRELKLFTTIALLQKKLFQLFGKPFPFEGNWNFMHLSC